MSTRADDLHRRRNARGVARIPARVAGHLRHELRRGLRPIGRWYQGCRMALHAGGVRAVGGYCAERARFLVLRLSGRGQSEQELAAVAMRYWNEGDKAGVDVRDYSHWLGAGPWRDQSKWLALGRIHHDLYRQFCRTVTPAVPVRSILEWGCGGGANAVHFCDEVDRYCGVDITQANLDECERVLRERHFDGFEPVLVSAEEPEKALDIVHAPYDCFLCTYVYELLPGRRYGERVSRIAYDLLKPGGIALIQIRYDDGTEKSNQKRLDYFRYACRFTSYRIDEFWELMQKIGFIPRSVFLAPQRIEGLSGDLYAYFMLQRPWGEAGDSTGSEGRVPVN